MARQGFLKKEPQAKRTKRVRSELLLCDSQPTFGTMPSKVAVVTTYNEAGYKS